MPDKKPMSKEDIKTNPDHKIDQDFEGYPGGPAKDETINPQSKKDKEAADMGRDGEKLNIKPQEREGLDEQESDGSAGAFEEK